MTEKDVILSPTYVTIANSDQAGPTDLLKCHDGSSAWCCLGWCFPLTTAFCIGRKMKENKSWLKYGIPG